MFNKDISAKGYALKLLQKKDYSVSQLRRKMKMRNFPLEDIDATLTFLLEKNFLNDERFVQNFIRSSSDRFGPYKIEQKLLEKGINSEIVKQTLAEINPSKQKDAVKKEALNLLAKHYPVDTLASDEKYKIKAKIFRRLVGLGFDYGIIEETLNSLF